MTTLYQAFEYLQNAQFANYSGQIMEQYSDGGDRTIICELGCTCSEVPSRNADEYGEMLVTLLNGAGQAAAILKRIIANYDQGNPLDIHIEMARNVLAHDIRTD